MYYHENNQFLEEVNPSTVFANFNPFRNSPVFHVSAVQVLKTLWEKEKLLVTSNFSFFPKCFLSV